MTIESLIVGLVALASSVSIFLLGLRIQQDAKERNGATQKRGAGQQSAPSVAASPDVAAKVNPTYMSGEKWQ